MQLDAYVRVSRVAGRSGESFISPDVQRTQIARWAELRNTTIGEWHTDLDQSGAKDDRPGLRRVLERIEAGETGGVIVAKLDRFARSLPGALEAIRRIDDAGGKFVSVAEGIDPTTSAGKLQQNIMLVFAEFELDRIRDNWLVAQERAVARGIHIASRVPTGYVRGEDGRLEPHQDYAPVVAELFEMRAQGDSWRMLSDHLAAQGVPTPYGAMLWSTEAVRRLLRNRVYLGEARSGRFANPEAHPPIVGRSMWEAAQSARVVSTPRSDHGALLAGLLRCAGCRYVLKPDTMKLYDGSRARIYRCRGRHPHGVCPDRSAVMGRVIEPYVEARFFAELGDLVARPAADGDLEDARLALVEAEAQLRRYRDDERISGALGPDLYVEGLQARAAAVDETAHRLGDLQRRETMAPPLAHATSLRGLWPGLTSQERQRLLGAAWDTIMLRSGRRLPIEDRVAFVEHGDGPADLPRRGRRVPLASWPWPDDRPASAGVAAPEDP